MICLFSFKHYYFNVCLGSDSRETSIMKEREGIYLRYTRLELGDLNHISNKTSLLNGGHRYTRKKNQSKINSFVIWIRSLLSRSSEILSYLTIIYDTIDKVNN